MPIARPLFHHLARPLGAIALLASLGGAPAMAETVDLPVVVRLAEGATLPPDAMLEVELLDVSRADAPATVLSAHRYRVEVLPVIVKLPYDDDAIDPRMSYIVAGKVRAGDSVVLRTTTAFPAITRDAPARPEITLEQTGTMPVADLPRITGIEWAAFEIGGRMMVTEDPPSMAFNEDGTFSMYGGCNRFTGRAEIGAGTLHVLQPLAGTRRACPEPRMNLDKAMVAALEQTTGFVRYGKNLSLTNAAGVAVLRLTERPE
ncbi:META domain-containing protein [Salipiger mangrovisoli]|uniref:META domain-containing protein n=1 Tax=Salipiger mangrovisoli TaxID=2865933 RepID=A0ABR9WZW6_9RHOB|nr:META domain-containing protein [Salipiger mangrovisoli]MBE9636796.1 META domain-containing protein [Salipiger mangrovisoli]